MKSSVETADRDQPAMAALRCATRRLHQDLHRHPLCEELLARPTLACYQTFLEAWFAFYWTQEAILVQRALQLGLAEQYPQAIRTRWLIADLRSLGCDTERLDDLGNRKTTLDLTEVGRFVGCLYVVSGSAMGGRAILEQLPREISQRCSGFLQGHGSQTDENWQRFGRFCNDACGSRESRRLAMLAARETFASIADCLTWVWHSNLELLAT